MTTAQLPPAGTLLEPSDKSFPDARQRARISFRQPVATTGFIDAAWWPRTRDLTAELPALMDVVWTAGREVNRITYHMRAWDVAPRRMQIEGRSVRLGGFTVGDPDTVRLSDPWARERIDILVIPPETDPDVAQRVFDLASEAGSSDRAQEILRRAKEGAGV